MQEIPSAPTRRKSRRFLSHALAGLMILGLLAGAGSFLLSWLAGKELQDAISQLDRDDPDWRLDKIEANRKVIPPEKNSALHAMATSKLHAAGAWKLWQNRKGERVEYGRTFHAQFESVFEKLTPQAQLNDQQVGMLHMGRSAVENVILEARKLKDMPEGRYPIAYAANPYATLITCHEARALYEPLWWDIAWRAHLLETDGAMESCLALVNACRSIGDEPFLISQLIRYAGHGNLVLSLERVLAQGTPSDGILKDMQQAIDAEISVPTLWIALRGERAGFHNAMEAITQGTLPASTIFGVGNQTPRVWVEKIPGRFKQEHARILRIFTEMVDAAKLPPYEQEAAFAAIDVKLKGDRSQIAQIVPASGRVFAAYRRTQAQLRCALIALAAEGYRLEKKELPKTLDDLVAAKFLDAIPDDPFAPGPLRLKHEPNSLVIYSVGPDGADNAGNLWREENQFAGLDIGFRLWNVNARRQPPMPPVPLNSDE